MKESLLMRLIGVGRRFFNSECGIILGASRNLGGKSSLGARLRTRKVTAQGRFAACDPRLPRLTFPFELVRRGTVGALPQTPQGALPLDPAKGSSTLWTPIFAIELASSPCFARVFILLVLRLSPFSFLFSPRKSSNSLRVQSRVSSVHPPSSQYNPTQIY